MERKKWWRSLGVAVHCPNVPEVAQQIAVEPLARIPM